MSRPSAILVLAATFAGNLVAGEIIVAPQQANPPGARSSGEQRERARAYQGEAPSGGTLIVVPEEEGILSPRTGGAEGRAQDNRKRAKQLQGGKEAADIEIVVPGGDPNAPRNKAGELRSRAAGYSRGESRSGASGKANDGLPIVVCKDSESVAGRIGDDAVSGGVIILIREGKPVKVRCQ